MDYSSFFFWGISLALLFIHLFTSARRFFCSTHQLPPGPFPLPLIGNLLNLGSKPHVSLTKLAKYYGPLMTVKFASQTTIVVSSISMAKEVLRKNDQYLSARTVPDAMRVFDHHETSLVWLPSNPQWRNLRRLLATLMFSAERLNRNQEMRQAKVGHLVEYLREKAKSGVAIDIAQVVFSNTINMISNTLFSIDLTDFGSKLGQDIKATVKGVLKEAGKSNLGDFFPLLRPLDILGVRQRMTAYFLEFDDIFDNIIDQRLQSRELGHASSNDVLDALLQYLQENGSKLRRLDIVSLLKDLFIAGTDTSTGTLEWAMTELLHNRDILVKAKLELKENVGKGNSVKESDITQLPYLQAVVKETLRLHPPKPLLVPHTAEADVEICGYTVPKHAQVLVNFWAIGRDPELWDNPNSFLPDRFMESTSVDYKGGDFEFIPFGAGRRICPGLPLAHRMVNLTLASLLHSFDWELDHGMKPVEMNMEDKFGVRLSKAQPLLVVPIEA